jgi:4-amino-4-deoxy-L-arabinose transferase-like glycosyltransferase
MESSHNPESFQFNDSFFLYLLAFCVVILHVCTNGNYGFHRDELQTLDDARHMDWGFVAYPPVTPAIEHVALWLFGTSLIGLRLFSALGQGLVIVLTGRMARELGGKRLAQIIAALAVAIAPLSLFSGTEFQYTSFDYLWWVLIAYSMIRLLKSDDPRWWLAIGAAIGVGMMTKYSMLSFVAGVVAGFLFTPARRYLKSPWLWGGVALALLIFLPNLIWEIRHNFITLDFLRHIHARDVGNGRTDGFIKEQFTLGANLFTVPLWLAGLSYFFFVPDAKRYRLLGWMYVIPFIAFFVAKGRFYYLAPAYPMLLAGGAVWEERWIATLSVTWSRVVRGVTFGALAIGGALACEIIVPILPLDSPRNVAIRKNGDLREEVGWTELVATVANIRNSLPAADQTHLGIMAGNYGEAGAINLYGPSYGLPPAISGVNSFWLRSYPESLPQTLIVIGFSRGFMDENFQSCELAGPNPNRYRIKNEESTNHPDIYVCRQLRTPWPEFWKRFSHFG